jgi:hypothetical protein
LLIFATIYMLRKFARGGPSVTDDHTSGQGEAQPGEMPSLVGAQD